MVGAFECTDGITADQTEGPTWNRLYGNASYWNGNLYMAMSNGHARQYQFTNSGLLNTTPAGESTNTFGNRGGNSVVSANATTNGIVWIHEKSASGVAILHAYDANNIRNELWNSNQNVGRDGMGTGISFGTPVVADGQVFAPYDRNVAVYSLLQ